MTEDEIYEKIYDELSVDRLVGSTWVKSYELANGDDKLAKAKYISLRYEEIKKESINNDLISEKVKKELALLNKIRYQADKDNALNSLSSLRHWYIYNYGGDIVLSDAQLEKVIELSRNSQPKRPAVPERYRFHSERNGSSIKSDSLSSNNIDQSKVDVQPKVISEKPTEYKDKKSVFNFISWVFICIFCYLIVKIFGLVGGGVALGSYVLIVNKFGKLVAVIISVIAGFLASIISTMILL